MGSQSVNMEKVKDKSKDLDTLNKFSVNQFVIKCRPISSQGKVHIVKKLLQHAKQYRRKKTKKEEEKEKNSRKADRFIQEVMFIKKLHPDEITKFSLLNKKTFKKVGDDPKSSIEERALCRLAEHKSVSAAIEKFREKYPKWDDVLQEIVKGLGLRHRKEKLKRLQEKGKIDTYLEKEQNSLKILQQVGVLKLDKKIVDHGNKKIQSKKEDYLKDRPFNTHSQNKNLDPLEKLNTEDIHNSEIENEEVNSDEGLGSSEEQQTELTQESETDSEADIMVNKLGQNLQDSGDNNDSSESEGDSDEENVLEGVKDSDDNNDIMVTKLGQNLKKSGDNDESSKSEEDSDEENELEGVKDSDNQNDIENEVSTTEEDSDTDNEEGTNVQQKNKSKVKITNKTKKYLKKMNKKVIKTSPTKMSRTVEVKTIDLSVTSDINMENNRQLKSETESEDEDFFKKPDKDGKIPKRKRKKNKSSFFLREGEDNDGSESEVSEESDDDNYLKRQRADSDDDRIDTGKYFRKNIYRGDQPGGDNSNDRGRGRGGMDRGRGRGFDTQRGRGRDNDRGRGRNFGSNNDSFNQDKKESSGFGGRGRGRGFNDRRGGRGRGFGERGRPDRKFGNNGNEFNANFVELNPNQTKSTIKASGPIAAVHPSWVAKQKLKQQSAGLNSFQGKRMTFDD